MSKLSLSRLEEVKDLAEFYSECDLEWGDGFQIQTILEMVEVSEAAKWLLDGLYEYTNSNWVAFVEPEAKAIREALDRLKQSPQG